MNNNYFTQTKNFSSASIGDVDPRTGLFSFNMELAKITGNQSMGPEVSLGLSYSPTSDINQGFGVGVLAGFTLYDKPNNTLTLNTGEQYTTEEDGDDVIIHQLKNASFIFTKTGSNHYQICYDNGVVEKLSLYGDHLFLPVTIYSPLGYSLSLAWDDSDVHVRLLSISDETELLCQLEYPSGAVVNIAVFPDTDEYYSVQLQLQNDYLQSVSHISTDATLTWSLGYDTQLVPDINQTLTKITSPTGVVKQATYEQNVFRFPADSGMSGGLPAVVTYTVTPGMDQPELTTTYDYTLHGQNNYLGYGGNFDREWSASSDNLYNIMSDYLYGTTVTNRNGEEVVNTSYSYNNYHLMVNSNMFCGTTSRLTEMEYYAEVGLVFDDQPNQYQCLRSQTVTWMDTSLPEGKQSRSEVTLTSYNDECLLTQKTTPDGTVIDIEYYPAAGESDAGDTGCPAEPSGFVRYVKKVTHTPAPSDYDDVPVQAQYVKFTAVDTLTGAPVSYNVLPLRAVQYADAIQLTSQEYAYNTDDSTSAFYGRTRDVTATVFADNGSSYVLTEHKDYQLQDTDILESTTLTTYDGITLTVQRANNKYNGKLHYHINAQGIETVYEYDSLGRLKHRVTCSGTEYESAEQSAYSLAVDENGHVIDIMTTITDRYGNVQNLHFDGPGRVLFIEQNNIDNNLVDTFFEMKRNEYDAMGRKYKTVTTDFIDPLNDPKNITQLETTTQYDSWGQPYLSQVSSGQNQYQTNDPVNMTSTSWFCATSDTTQEMGKVCTQYNIQKLPTSVTQIDINGNSKGSLTKTYDGLGRLRSSTDELNHTTSWTYDPFSRVSTQTLPDSTVVTRTYAPQSGAPLDKTISVTASDGTQYPLLGEQTFDGLGRLLTTTCGGRTTTCTYDDTFDMPLTVTDNLNQTLTYQYIPELGNALEHVTGQQLFQSFTFDPASAELQSDEEVGGQATVSGWYPSSRSQYQTVTSTTGAERTASYSWTLAGNLLTYQDVTGNLQTITPDEFGRLYTVGDDEVLLTMGWRDDGRFDHQVAKDLTNQSTLTTTIIPDDFNREGIRQLDASDGSSVSIVTTYYDNDQVETITVSRDGVTLRKEHFYYDSRNRLQTYSCSGTSLPVDGYGQEIVSQVFTMDVINNIQTCVTTTPDGLVDTATFIYGNPDDPTQLTSVTHSGNDSYPASITLHYDDNGRMTLDEAGRILTYDEAGRLSTVTPVAGSPCSYGYDAHNTLVLQSLADDDTRLLYYAGSKLVNEIQVEKNQYSRMRQGMSGSAAVSEGELSS